jgi:hypothetical protein
MHPIFFSGGGAPRVLGMSTVVQRFLSSSSASHPDRAVICATIDDAPHFSEADPGRRSADCRRAAPAASAFRSCRMRTERLGYNLGNELFRIIAHRHVPTPRQHDETRLW